MWYVIQVVNGQEHRTVELIKSMITGSYIGECFCPMRERQIKKYGKWNKVLEKLFPGYVFITTDFPEEVFLQLKQVPRMTKLLGDGENTFIPLSEQEVSFIEKFGNQDHVSHLSEVKIEEGNRVVVVDGDLKDYEGQIVKVNLHKRVAIVRTEFMGTSVDVYLGIEILNKI